jgi:hypothetical protein
MEPRASMTGYAAAILLATILLALGGHTAAVVALSVGIGAYAALLDLSYLARRRKRRMLALSHRRFLDCVVRAQWITLATVGTGVALTLAALDTVPFDDADPAVNAIIVGWVVLWTIVYVSALVDWYWILPKVSGIVAPPPCTVVGGKTFDRMTGLWLFHRGAATALVTFVLAGVPAWIAGTIDEGSWERTLLTLVGAALAIGFNAVNAGTVWALKQFNHPLVAVGWYVRERKDVNEPEPQDAYVLDVAVSGIKYKLESDINGKFVHDGLILPFSQVDPKRRSNRQKPVCPSLRECQAANWYCLRNRNAHGDLAPGEHDPAPLPAKAPER